ncbi:Osmotin, thaumatin-like protein [Dendrothele bispora CBS 962.96]|uniref:Osmotin, thaumatin-like protein n=1 Tax=Dendrothele bispora (strain CBS 962.96) TaxID=1314807 RepID=A0A4S8MCZ9_DENBC|nr:Osmotin, thaumatin-like protein [Dendrothele bispora CBS 962.96]
MKFLILFSSLVLVNLGSAHPIHSNSNGLQLRDDPATATPDPEAPTGAPAPADPAAASTGASSASDPAAASSGAPAASPPVTAPTDAPPSTGTPPSTGAPASTQAPDTGGGKMRTWTVKNNCAYTIWPGMYTDPNVGKNKPNHTTGWEAPPGSSVSFGVPDDWKAGRIWGRTKCDFSKNSGADACETGGCNGGLECATDGGTGVPPASLAEWTLQGDGNQDWYDVSVVDGANIPLEITNNAGCKAPSCKADLDKDCPAELKGKKGGGCLSACAANLDGNPGDSPNCCSGSHNKPETCPPSGVQHYDFFKKGCPDAYVYAYDESSKAALWTCDSSKHADYTLTFCPS